MDFSLNFGIIGENNSKTVDFDIKKIYDVIIIGGGPAGLTAAVYCMRKGLKTGIIAKNIGGQVSSTKGIENYMGYKYIEGMELVDKFREQIKQFEISYLENENVVLIKNENNINYIKTEKNLEYKTKTVIIATGSKWKSLGVKGEKELIGKGVGYCTTCDAPLFKNKDVVVVGGGNSGIEAALDLIKIAKSVSIIEFMPKIKADDILIKKLKEYNNHKIYTNYQVTEINGENKVENIKIKNRNNEKEEVIKTDGVFIEIGLEPNTEFVKGLLNTTKNGHINIDCACNTNVKSIFAAGDVTSIPFNQIIIAAGEGAKAALSAYKYLTESE